MLAHYCTFCITGE